MERRFTTLGKNLNQKILAQLGKEVFFNYTPEQTLEYWENRPLRGIIDESLYFMDYQYADCNNPYYQKVINLIDELKTS